MYEKKDMGKKERKYMRLLATYIFCTSLGDRTLFDSAVASSGAYASRKRESIVFMNSFCYYKCINEIAAMVGSLLDLIMQLLFSRRSSCVLKFKLKSSVPLSSNFLKMGLILIYLADGLVGAIF